jgi:predicted RNA-binding protein with TRAM domain
VELEKQTRRRFYLEAKEGVHLDHFLLLAEGKRDELAPEAPVAEGAKIELKLVEVGLHDPQAGVGKVDGFDVCVADAAKLVGKKVNVQIERVLNGTGYGTIVTRAKQADLPITAEGEAEKPTRRPAAKKTEPEAEEAVVVEESDAEKAAQPKKKTRRGTRGGRGRKRKTTAAAATPGDGAGEPAEVTPPVVAKIHVPDPELGEPEPVEESGEDGSEAPKPRKKTRRGTRGGRGRKRKTATAAAPTDGGETTTISTQDEDWQYVPMSEWADEIIPSDER